MASLAGIAASSLVIPFRTVFKHTSAKRSETATVWVQVRSENGVTGYGEGCPRKYVTGETVKTALAFVDQIRSSVLKEISDIHSMNEWIRKNTARIDENPAAWCAVELALLDLLARTSGRSVETLLGSPELSGDYHYSAVLGDSDDDAFARQLEQYSKAGFRDFKLKISGDPGHDRNRMALVVNAVGKGVRIRLDANNLWVSPSESVSFVRGLDAPIFAVEEPLGAGDYAGAAIIAEELGIPVILDESFTQLDQISEVAAHPHRWILNLRVSKLGGIGRSLSIAEAARSAGLRIIIGAQVGETSLLTRAALTLANASRDILVAQEGAFGTLLLEEDVCTEPLIFGPGGRLDVGERFREHAGFGLVIDPDRIAEWSEP